MSRMPASVAIDPSSEDTAAEGAHGAPGAAASVTAPVRPDPEVPVKVQRRQFPAGYRRRILKEADACKKHGALGALLRREGFSTVRTW